MITSVLITVLQTSDTWQQKKVKKTMLTLNIFTKLTKNIVMSKEVKKDKFRDSIAKNGTKLFAEIEKECEKDKSMSNLKGKVKEIQKILDA